MTRIIIPFLILVLAGCSHMPTSAISPLDQAVRGSTEKEIFVGLYALRGKLPDDAQGVFEAAFSCLTSEFRAKVCAGLSEEEKERAFVAAFDGFTPRQVILFGSALHLEICEQADTYEDTLQGDEKAERHAHMQEHLEGLRAGVIATLKKYGKGANKTPLPTPVERPPSNHSQVPGAADL